MAFDKKAYRDDVIAPLSKNAAQQAGVAEALRGIHDAKGEAALVAALTRVDLVALFALTPGMSDAQVVQHLQSVEAFLNMGRPPVSKLVGQLLKAVKSNLPGHVTATFWDTLREASTEAGRQELVGFGAAVKAQEVIGLVTPDRLRSLAKAHGLPASLSDRDLADAVKAHGVAVESDFEAPNVSLSAPPLKKELHAMYRTPVDVLLLHDRSAKPSDLRVVEELSAPSGAGRRRITLQDLEQSRQAANTRGDDANESAKKTLNAIAAQCPNDGALHKMVLAWFLDLAEDLVHKQGMLVVPALERLKGRGLADLDAKRVLAKLSTTSTGPGLNDVKELMATGDLQSARRLMTALSADQKDGEALPEAMRLVASALDKAEEDKQSAIAAARQALQANDFPAARAALGRAAALDGEDHDVARLLKQLPPDAPSHLAAEYSSTSGGVVLAWRGSQDGDVQYAVTRSEAGTPPNPQSGTRITAATSEQRALDATPLPATRVTYAVFASKPGTDYSLPASVQVTVLPAPTKVDAVVTTSDVTLYWHAAPEASGVTVEMIGADGNRRLFTSTSSNKLLVEGLVIGEKYTFNLVADYVLKQTGQSMRSQVVSVSATPRGKVAPVDDLAVSSVTLPNGTPGHRASWGEVPGFSVDLWALPIDETVQSGRTVTESDLEGVGGQPVRGTVRVSGSRHTLDFLPLRDVRAIVPVTWDRASGVLGTPVVTGSAPPPGKVEAVRQGAELMVSWVWPHGDYQMDVRWVSSDGRSRSRRIDRFDYRRDNGFRIDDDAQVTQIQVATVAIGGRREYASNPVIIELQAAAPVLSYTLKLPRGLFGGRDATVTLESSGFSGRAEIVAVIAPGSFMPMKADAGQEIARFTADFTRPETLTQAFTVPKFKGTYWVRLFPGIKGQCTLEDPPTASMRG